MRGRHGCRQTLIRSAAQRSSKSKEQINKQTHRVPISSSFTRICEWQSEPGNKVFQENTRRRGPRRHGSRNWRRKVELLPKRKKQYDPFTETVHPKWPRSVKVLPSRLPVNMPATALRSCRLPSAGLCVTSLLFPCPQTLEGVSRRVCPSPERDINLANLRGLPACEKLFLFLPADTASKRILRGFAAPV